jgi:hypothetical protein
VSFGARIGFSHAILTDITPSSYGDRWCCHTYALAWHALHHTGTGAGMRLYRIERLKQ